MGLIAGEVMLFIDFTGDEFSELFWDKLLLLCGILPKLLTFCVLMNKLLRLD